VIKKLLHFRRSFRHTAKADPFFDRKVKCGRLRNFGVGCVNSRIYNFGVDLFMRECPGKPKSALRFLPKFGSGKIVGKSLIVEIAVFGQFFYYGRNYLFVGPAFFK
jgi:hypothetical protein